MQQKDKEEIKYRTKTQSEIKDIDPLKIKEQSLQMLNTLDYEQSLTIPELQDKYNYLFTKLPSLFNLIIRDKQDSNNKTERIGVDGVKRPFVFNTVDFTRNLDILLNQFGNIQTNKIQNQDEKTHKQVCDQFTSKYIPSKFLK
jgi:hypothetical protein